jgi:hypothetical protein
MYSESRVLEKLVRFKEKYHWVPVEHSVEEVDKVNAHFKTLYKRDNKGDLYFDDDSWTPKLKRWVMNERALCALDCGYFLTRYFWLTENEVQHFAFRSGQRALYSVVQELEKMGVSKELQCLKARKQGISTLLEGMMTHAALMIPGARCSIGSADDQKTAVMMDMMYGALEHIPWWLPPTQTKDKRSGRALLQFSHVGSSIVVQHGAMHGGIGQGTTPNKVHLSEVCDYTDPVAQIEEGLFKAVPSMPEILLVLESTGNGNTGWWAEQWRRNKEKYWDGRARLLPIFLPWFMTPELYPTPHWIQKFPFPGDWHPERSRDVTAMVAKCEAYVRAAPMLERILGKNWRLPDEQKWYWQWNWEDSLARRQEKSWTRQMPCDDYEALIGENDNAFAWETIYNIQTKRVKQMEIFGILGEGIEEKHDPPPAEVDRQGERIAVHWTTPHEIRLEWVLMPMTGDPEDSKFNPFKKFIVYERPQRGYRYSIGVDTGTGVGGDRTAISVDRDGQDAVSDMQVAEFAADDIQNTEIFAWVMAIAAYYGRYMEDGQQPRIAIEQRRKYGDSCYHALKLHGFRNHHRFREYDKKTLRPIPSSNSREGWFTNEWSRPLILGTFKHAVDYGWYEVNSRWLLAEIEAYEQITAASGKTKMDHARGKHDDRIFAAAMSYFTFHDNDLMAERAKKRYSKAQDEGYKLVEAPWYPSVPNPGAEEYFRQFEEVA